MSLAAFVDARTSTRWCPHEPTPKQAAFLALDGMEALYGGAAGGGKSDALLMGALAHVDVPGYTAILFRRAYTDLALPGAIMDRSHEWLGGTAARWSDREKRWTFPSGATLTFGFLDGPRDRFRYQSAEFQFIGFDEVTQFQERDYLYLFSRLRRTRGLGVPLYQRAATNPGDIGHEWVKRRFITAPGDRAFVSALLDDNPHLDREAYDVALANLDPVTRRQLRHGDWVRDPSGLVYSSLDPDRNVVDALPVLPVGETWTRVFAADFGSREPTAFAVWYFTEHDPCAYLVASAQWVDMSPGESAEEFLRWQKEHGPFERVVGDLGGLGAGYETEWRRRFGLALEPAEKVNKLGFIKLMNGDFSAGRIRVLADNTSYLRDTLALAWHDERCQKEHPTMANHLPDAGLYGWRACRSYQAVDREERPPVGSFEAQVREVQARKRRSMERAAKREAWGEDAVLDAGDPMEDDVVLFDGGLDEETITFGGD